jgi:hypothetical protein
MVLRNESTALSMGKTTAEPFSTTFQMYYLLQLYQGFTGYEGEEQYSIKTVSERILNYNNSEIPLSFWNKCI